MTTSMITEDLVKTIIGKRNREIHKGDCGRILISAGSREENQELVQALDRLFQ